MDKWIIAENSGDPRRLWRPVETHGDLRIKTSETHGDLRRLMEISGDPWRPMETSGDPWRPVETRGDQWRPMETSGDSQITCSFRSIVPLSESPHYIQTHTGAGTHTHRETEKRYDCEQI